MRSPKVFLQESGLQRDRVRKALGEREARALRGNWNARPQLPQGWVCIRTPPFSILCRSKGQPREKKDTRVKEIQFVLPFLSGAQVPGPSSLIFLTLCFFWLGQYRLKNFSVILRGLFNQTHSVVTFSWQMKSRWPPPGFAQLVASNSVTFPKKGSGGTGSLS